MWDHVSSIHIVMAPTIFYISQHSNDRLIVKEQYSRDNYGWYCYRTQNKLLFWVSHHPPHPRLSYSAVDALYHVDLQYMLVMHKLLSTCWFLFSSSFKNSTLLSWGIPECPVWKWGGTARSWHLEVGMEGRSKLGIIWRSSAWCDVVVVVIMMS